MSEQSYPEFEPAWVEPEGGGASSLKWLGKDGRPGDEIGVVRECDVPGIHTPAAAQQILAMPLDKQAARLWAPAEDI